MYLIKLYLSCLLSLYIIIIMMADQHEMKCASIWCIAIRKCAQHKAINSYIYIKIEEQNDIYFKRASKQASDRNERIEQAARPIEYVSVKTFIRKWKSHEIALKIESRLNCGRIEKTLQMRNIAINSHTLYMCSIV